MVVDELEGIHANSGINGEWCLLFFVAISVEPKSSGFNALIRILNCMSY